MCGIVGYYGTKDAIPILINGLKRLEYRGYDSAGIAVHGDASIDIIKKAGKVKQLETALMDSTLRGNIGIAHTRWATHGEPNDVNAHPHLDHTESIAVIHNGIIENHDVLRTALEDEGVEFVSETDSEVLVQLISSIYKKSGLNFSDAVRAALQEVIGAYGIIVMSKDDPDTIVAARYGSPLVLGVGKDEYFIASDASPIIEHTRNVIFLEEGEMVTISPKGHEIKKIHENKIISKLLFKK